MLFRHRDTRFNSMAAKQAETKYSLRSLIDKLGVKPDASVAVLGIQDEGFLQQLKQRTSDVREDRLRKRLDTIFLLADNLEELEQLERLRDYLKSNGAIWVVSTKGEQARIKDLDVIAAAKRAGLVDNKVVSFSETHTALNIYREFYLDHDVRFSGGSAIEMDHRQRKFGPTGPWPGTAQGKFSSLRVHGPVGRNFGGQNRSGQLTAENILLYPESCATSSALLGHTSSVGALGSHSPRLECAALVGDQCKMLPPASGGARGSNGSCARHA
jgi:hypothetical protein